MPCTDGTGQSESIGCRDAAAETELRLHLRWLAGTYERVQRIRIDSGERIRAVAQGRAAGALPDAGGAERLLQQIRTGQDDGPVPVLGCTYRVHWQEELRLRAAMGDALADHPAWEWLREVKGVGPTLGAKLLSRLDIQRAPTPSAFWSYCGLATVAADAFRCSRCNVVRLLPRGRRPHSSRGHNSAQCGGEWQRELTLQRVAPPAARAGERAAFDRTARRICYQLGLSLLRAKGPYATFYRHQRTMLERSARNWTRAHVHMAALRKTEKLLLAHLWVEWAREVGLDAIGPYAQTRLLQPHCIAPAEMTGAIEAEISE